MRQRLSPVLLLVAVLTALGLSGCGATGSTTGSVGARASAAASSAAPSATGAAPTSYVALGDSYSAAPGVPTTSIAGGCLRSDHDYPHLLAAARPELVLTDVTCTGATTADLVSGQRILTARVAPQLEALRRTTGLVTLGIGGNDLGLFQTLLDHCLRGDQDCLSSIGTRDTSEIERHLVTTLHRIHRRAPSARIVLVGYPQPVPADEHGCARLPATVPVLAAVRGLIVDLSSAMARAAHRAGATYVDLIGPSAGHDVCSASPWINGRQSTDQAIAFHPLLAEQQAVAALLQRALG